MLCLFKFIGTAAAVACTVLGMGAAHTCRAGLLFFVDIEDSTAKDSHNCQNYNYIYHISIILLSDFYCPLLSYMPARPQTRYRL